MNNDLPTLYKYFNYDFDIFLLKVNKFLNTSELLDLTFSQCLPQLLLLPPNY
jgi:hypothetical protein